MLAFAGGTAFSLWVGGELIAARPAVIGASPADLHAEDLVIGSGDRTIRGWWMPGDRDKASVLLLHGIRANRLAMVGRAHAGQAWLFGAADRSARAWGKRRSRHYLRVERIARGPVRATLDQLSATWEAGRRHRRFIGRRSHPAGSFANRLRCGGPRGGLHRRTPRAAEPHADAGGARGPGAGQAAGVAAGTTPADLP